MKHDYVSQNFSLHLTYLDDATFAFDLDIKNGYRPNAEDLRNLGHSLLAIARSVDGPRNEKSRPLLTSEGEYLSNSDERIYFC